MNKFVFNQKQSLVFQSFAILVPILMFWAMNIEPNLIIVKKIIIPINKLPLEYKNTKIAFISDVHAGSTGINKNKINKITELINKEKPDIVLLGGDFEVKQNKPLYKYQETKITASILKNIKTKYGIYSCLGNHDHWYGQKRITEELESNKIKVLNNQIINLGDKSKPLFIAGIDDFTFGAPDISILYKISPKEPLIVLSHEPDIFPYLPKSTSLLLTGHTHGGQIRLPFVGAITSPSFYGTTHSKGLFNENGKLMFVTSGIGTSIFPARFLDIPEIVIIELTTI